MLVFDCDGVLLNSNQIKCDAFRKALSNCPPSEVDAFMAMHRSTAGVSRFAKFDWMAKRAYERGYDFNPEQALHVYAHATRLGLMECEVTPGLSEARARCDQVWAVVSGGAEEEVRDVLTTKGLNSYFEAGIYGSPRDKIKLLTELGQKYNLSESIFFGDAAYDHDSAIHFGMSFHFIWGWTEMENWQDFCAKRSTVSAVHKYVADYWSVSE